MRDFAELFFSFLWFHHKKIAGLILIAGLGYWIYYVRTQPKSKDRDSVVERTIVQDDVPSANLDFVDSVQVPTGNDDDSKSVDSNQIETGNSQPVNSQPVNSQPVNSQPVNSQAIESPVEPKVTTSTQPSDSQPSDSQASNKKRSTSANLETFLNEATVDELIEKSLRLGEQWGKAAPATGIVMCSERAKIARRLLEFGSDETKLSDAQRKYALISYIESISLVDSLNVAGKMNLSGTREALAEIERKYCDHVDADVKAKANISMIVAPIYDFLESDEKKDLQAFETELNKRFGQLSGDQSSLIRLAELTTAVLGKSTDELETDSISKNVLARIESVETPVAKEVALRLKENIIFSKFEPSALPIRVENRDGDTRARVQGFFQTLSENPNSSQGIYESAMRVILAYHLLNRQADVVALSEWLEKIIKSIEKESNRDAALDALTKLRVKVGAEPAKN